ncbi:MAG: helix-turn-helix domain-containing protein [Candidatus Cybelea sp.]
MDNQPPQMYSIDDAAHRIDISHDHLMKLVFRGEIKMFRGFKCFKKEDLDDLAARKRSYWDAIRNTPQWAKEDFDFFRDKLPALRRAVKNATGHSTAASTESPLKA